MLEQKEAEIAHLKARLVASEKQLPPQEGLQAALETKDEECALMMAAKHKELEFLASLLQMREQQIEELQQVPQSRSLGSNSPYYQGSQLEEAQLNQQVLRELQRLRLRMEDLEALVTEQQDRCSTLAEQLQRKAEHVEVLEQEIRSLRADAWGEAPLEEARHGLNDPMNGDRETPSRMEIFPSPSNPSPASQAESYCAAVRREHELEGAQSTGRQSQELLREMRRLRQQMNELEKVAAGREHPETSFGEGVLSPQNAEPQAINPAPTSLKRLPKTSLSEDPLSGWEYRAKPDDPVDAAVAELVNSRYRAWRALLCRLEQGVYLCGTRRVRIRVDEARRRLEASEDGLAWSDLTQIMTGLTSGL
ncbi:unnamed protein product [Durusdinium trenchii]